MKKLIAILFFATVALNTTESFAAPATTVSTSITGNENKAAAEAKVLTSRLKEIHKLSKTQLSAEDKQALRKEVVSIDERLQALAADGVYISVGALLLIIILLIILL